ncbi:MAG: PTH1 family peptidyl-tRNA hydrolase [Flavobacteriales bacterium]|jgi:PTH1 family peptidyl-tRNA hydrolase
MKVQYSPIRLIVGLGNPGSDYSSTRHNAGQDLVEELARQASTNFTPESKFFGLSARITLAGHDVRLLIPTTFMNKSGLAVAALANFYKIETANILVVHDELDLAPGSARLKVGGGHGGHNGLRDIIASRGNDKNFARLRLGIGHPGSAKDVASYVLKRASKIDINTIDDAIVKSIAILPELAAGNFEKAMLELHTHT